MYLRYSVHLSANAMQSIHALRAENTGNSEGLMVAILFVVCLAAEATAQARLVINNNAWVRVDNGAWVVIENPAPTGIQTLGTGGNIRSEGEFNRIRWQIRNSVGSYVIPFTTATGVKMPLTYTVIGAGSNDAEASICFSTYNHASVGVPLASAWNNDLYKPTDVTHMDSYNAPSVPNSQNAVDRFWIIDPGVPGYAYGTRPSIALNFVYDASAVFGEVTAGNAIGPTDPVGAQRFNSPAGLWGDYLPAGAWAAGTPSAVTGATAGPADFFRSWTLANIFEPLPVELLDFAGTCAGAATTLRWATASERNSSHFDVERSVNGQDFVSQVRVEATGNSQSTIHYEWVDQASLPWAYYRLRQVDLDGTWTYGPVILVDCPSSRSTEIVNAWDSGASLELTIHSAQEEVAALQILDMSGKLIMERSLTLVNGTMQVSVSRSDLATGIYMLLLETTRGMRIHRVNVSSY